MAKRVIIVDDDEDLQRLLRVSFEAKGFEVHSITNGKEAMSYLVDEKNVSSSHLLILDRLLPDMDGLEILKTFRKKFPKFPVLILSILSSEKDVLSGLKSGALDYVAKPFSVPILMEKAFALME